LDKRLLEIELADFAALQAEAHKCQDACNQTHRLTVLAGLTPDEAVAQTARQLLAPTYAKTPGPVRCPKIKGLCPLFG
jgi:hypothetical protein